MRLASAHFFLSTFSLNSDQIYKIQEAGVETYVHNWIMICEVCIDAAKEFKKNGESQYFLELRRQAEKWILDLQFELFKSDAPEIMMMRELFEQETMLAGTPLLSRLKYNPHIETARAMIAKAIDDE